MQIRYLGHVAAACAALIFATPALADDLTDSLTSTLSALGDSFEPGEAQGFADMLETAPAGVTGDTLGHLLYSRRQFDKAAWFFGRDALTDPTDPTSLNNVAGLLTELYAEDPEHVPGDWLGTARLAAEAAGALAPNNAAYQNTIGNVALAQGEAKAAVEALTRASTLAANEPLYWTNLARALEAMGQDEAAALALARAHKLAPNGLELLTAVAELPNTAAPYQGMLGQACHVDYHCQEICPKSIIGGLMSVTCEMENASAQMDCAAGKPFAPSYNCQEDFPEYGIMIPGLNAGFSVALPGFSAHVKVNGDGSVDVRVEGGVSAGPVSGYLRGDGHYSPSHGASFDNFGGGVRVNILPLPGEAGQLASDLGHPPAHIELEQVGDGPAQVNVETYNAGILSF